MNKFLALAVLLLIIACSPQQPVTTAPQEPVVAVATEPVPPVVADIREASEEPEKAVLDTETAERLAQEQAEKARETLEHPPKLEPRDRTTIVEQLWQTFSELESYQFKTAYGAWFVRGDQVRYLPFKPISKTNFKQENNVFKEVYIDEVIFSAGSQTATGFCTGASEESNIHCEGLRLHDIPFTLAYTDFMIKLPSDWVKEYLNEAPVSEDAGKYYVKSVLTTRVQFKDGTDWYFNPKAGLPVQIIRGSLNKITFDDIVVNQVPPEKVIHRSRKDIPPEEPFYETNY